MQSQAHSPELYELTRAIPAKFIERPPQGKYGDYVPHFVIEQILIATVGPFDFDHVETIYGPVPATVDKNTGEIRHPALDQAVVGVVMTLTVTIDGRVVSVTEAGSCDAAAHEWNNGARLKKATSDALKRCAMRLGVGLHLWCKRPEQYFLPRVLRLEEEVTEHDQNATVGVEDQEEHG